MVIMFHCVLQGSRDFLCIFFFPYSITAMDNDIEGVYPLASGMQLFLGEEIVEALAGTGTGVKGEKRKTR